MRCEALVRDFKQPETADDVQLAGAESREREHGSRTQTAASMATSPAARKARCFVPIDPFFGV